MWSEQARSLGFELNSPACLEHRQGLVIDHRGRAVRLDTGDAFNPCDFGGLFNEKRNPAMAMLGAGSGIPQGGQKVAGVN